MTRYLLTRPLSAMRYGGGYVDLPAGSALDCDVDPEELATMPSDENHDGMDAPRSVDCDAGGRRVLVTVDDLREKCEARQ